jgi:GNAT superfamily N-acetyltransferase
MFVHKNFRGNQYGTASQLLQTLFQWTENEKINIIYLGTRSEFYAAHRFYEKNGFDEIPKSALPESFPLMKHDNKFYKFEKGVGRRM